MKTCGNSGKIQNPALTKLRFSVYIVLLHFLSINHQVQHYFRHPTNSYLTNTPQINASIQTLYVSLILFFLSQYIFLKS